MEDFFLTLSTSDSIQLSIFTTLVITLLYTVIKDIISTYRNRKSLLLHRGVLTFYNLKDSKEKYSRLELEIFNPSQHLITWNAFRVKTSDGQYVEKSCDLYSKGGLCDIRPNQITLLNVSWLNRKVTKNEISELVLIDYSDKKYFFSPESITEQVIEKIPPGEAWRHKA